MIVSAPNVPFVMFNAIVPEKPPNLVLEAHDIVMLLLLRGVFHHRVHVRRTYQEPSISV